MPTTRTQPARPDTPPAPKTAPAPEENGDKAPEAQRPRQTQQTSAEGRVIEGQVPKIELFKPAPIADADLEKLNVYQRWNRCISEIGLVPKRGWNDHHHYWFTTDADLNAFIGPLFGKYHLVVLPTIDIERVQRIEPAPGSKQWLTRVPMHVSVINADKPDDKFEVDWIGEGADTVDKGLYKAFTGGLKYFYMKLLQVATGDDPELFVQTDRIGAMAAEAAAQGGERPEGRQVQVRSSSRPQPQKGGHQDEATEVQLRQIKAMSHALQIGAEGAAAFIDKILGSSVADTIIAIEDDDAKSRALTEWLKTQRGTDVGKVIYEMGEEAKRIAAAKSEAAVAEATNPYAGAPESEAPPPEEAPPDDEDELLRQAAESAQ